MADQNANLEPTLGAMEECVTDNTGPVTFATEAEAQAALNTFTDFWKQLKEEGKLDHRLTLLTCAVAPFSLPNETSDGFDTAMLSKPMIDVNGPTHMYAFPLGMQAMGALYSQFVGQLAEANEARARGQVQ